MNYNNFYTDVEENSKNKKIIKEIKSYSEQQENKQIYLLNKPLGNEIYGYDNSNLMMLLITGCKVLFINSGGNDNLEVYEDYIEDIGYMSNKYEYIKVLGRPRIWKEMLTCYLNIEEISDMDINDILTKFEIKDPIEKRKGDILISLLSGSINDIHRVGEELPENLLEKVKKKIVLYDSNQTRFIYQEPHKKKITIQGMAGTGKTELLLHKLKDLYVSDNDNKIVMTCFNKVLEEELKRRIPSFFDFLRIEEQIKWNERLWVMRSWGSSNDMNSGVYSYICNYYGVQFHRYSYGGPSFSKLCSMLLKELESMEDFTPCFDYILIDESQDFSEDFFNLCEKVTSKKVYIAGDIFQDIFAHSRITELSPDFLLNKCYRTDPRTLMFAHALGMGLFEKSVLNWLDDDEWEAFGYVINKEENKYILSREPVQRFEDSDKLDYEGIKMVTSDKKDYELEIINIINRIITENQTVKPDDIGIVFLDNSTENYKLADTLEYLIKEKYDWDVAKGYETKTKIKDTIFISNRNNIKGLEFPFVICVLQSELTNNIHLRNSIYMMLTRSFITSYLILPSNSSSIEQLKQGIEYINKNNNLVVEEPSELEKKRIKEFSVIGSENKSQGDIIKEIVNTFKLSKVDEEKILKYSYDTIRRDLIDEDKIELFLNNALGLLREGMI